VSLAESGVHNWICLIVLEFGFVLEVEEVAERGLYLLVLVHIFLSLFLSIVLVSSSCWRLEKAAFFLQLLTTQ
jgi:hypothetical protein